MKRLLAFLTLAIAFSAAGQEHADKFSVLLEKYSAPKDSLKLRAAEFLLEGLPYQWHYDIALMEDKGVWKKVADAEVIDAEYLAENIEYAFMAWQLPWCRGIEFQQFCQYILPYKIGHEQPERWRKELWEEYAWVREQASADTDASTVCRWINHSVAEWFTTTLDYNYPTDIGYFKSREVARGTCYGASMVILYPLRALGVPSTFDYVPKWANRSGDHNWNALYQNGSLISFNGPDRDPGLHKIEFIGVGRMLFKRPKVYRKEYSEKGFSDVTAEYIPVTDVNIRIHHRKSEEVSLNTFNNRNWVPVMTVKPDRRLARFTDMARNVVFLPVSGREGSRQYVEGWPTLTRPDGGLKRFRPIKWIRRKAVLTAKYPEDESNLIVPGQHYELFYWDGRWKSLGQKTASGSELVYRNVPARALLWLRNLDEGVQERIFEYKGGRQIWY